MKKIAIVGFGFMGKTHYGAWKKCPGARVVAVCDSNLAQLTAKVTGNIKGAADNNALPASVKVWDDFDRMLCAGGFDIVDITLPTPLHARMSIAALNAGYHVLCEKPMAITLRECDAMLAAAKASGRCFLVAQSVRFFPEYRALAGMIRSGMYGKVLAADFSRFMAVPKWSPKGGSWLLDETKSGGLFVDTHVHDTDFIVSVFGLPKSVLAKGIRSPHGYTEHTTTWYDYGDGKIITSDSSYAAADSLLWDAAARVFFERATVYLGGQYKSPFTVYPQGGKPFTPKLGRRSGYEEEVRYFLALTEGKTLETVLTAEEARMSIRVVLAERQSAELGKLCLIGGE